jgi:hypothetical protein
LENFSVGRIIINSITKKEKKKTFSGLAQILRIEFVRIASKKGINGRSSSGAPPSIKTFCKTAKQRSINAKQ